MNYLFQEHTKPTIPMFFFFFFLFLMTKVIIVKTRHRLYNKSSILFLRINVITTLP